MTKGYQTFTDAATATGLTDRELVFVAGETDIGDTGQGHFIYRPAGTGAASIDIIVVTAGGRMFRATMPSSEVADQIATAIQGTDTPVVVSSLPATAATAANQTLIETAVDAVTAAVTAAGANVTAAAIASAMQGGTQPVSASALPLPTGAATSANQATLNALLPASLGGKAEAASLSVTTATDDPSIARTGIVTETAPASDTASSGLNGRLQRVAQRLSSLIALLPASLGGKTAANSLAVTIATDDPLLAAVNTLSDLETKAAATLATADWETVIAANADREMAYIVNTDPLAFLIREGTAGTGESLPSGETAFAVFNGVVQIKGAIGQSYDKAEG